MACSGFANPPLRECHVQNSSRDRMIGALSLPFRCLRPRLRSSHERRYANQCSGCAWTLLEIPSAHGRMIAGTATSPSDERGRVVAEGQQRARTAAAKHAGPRRATRVLHRAPAVLDPGAAASQRSDLVSQGRPRSARCGRLVKPPVLPASELVAMLPVPSESSPASPNNPAGRVCELLWSYKPRPWRTTTPCSS